MVGCIAYDELRVLRTEIRGVGHLPIRPLLLQESLDGLNPILQFLNRLSGLVS